MRWAQDEHDIQRFVVTISPANVASLRLAGQFGFRKIGEQLTADWLKKAGADGQAVVEAYKKSIGTN